MSSLRRETRNTWTGGSRAELQIDIGRSPPLGSKECHSAFRKDELLATNDLGGRIPSQPVEEHRPGWLSIRRHHPHRCW